MGESPTHRRRVQTALAHEPPDRTPRDFAAEPEVWAALQEHLGLADREAVRRHLDIDCRVLYSDWEVFLRPPGRDVPDEPALSVWRRAMPDGTLADIWGARRRKTVNEFGTYLELCNYPLADAAGVDDLRAHDWPEPDWWDFAPLAEAIDRTNPGGEYHLRYRIGSIFETAWSLRGFEPFLMDLVLRPEMARYIMDRLLEVHLANLERVMGLAADRFDMIYTYDDLAHQHALLMSVDMWKATVAGFQRKLFAAARRHDKPLMYHSCGAIRPLIGELIDMGLDVLNPIQPQAEGMDFAQLKAEFGDSLCFHGGIDIQQLLPRGRPEDVVREAARAQATLGAGGGYILAPAHHVQPDTPVANILALYGK